MAFTPYQVFLALLQISTGSINTLSTKWADRVNATGIDGEKRPFNHPFVQACAMFLGEFLCLLTFKVVYCILRRRNDGSEDVSNLTKGTRVFNPFQLFIPAMCDMVGTSLMYVGLTMTYASSFQMFRGSVIIFVALLSIIFLRRRLVVRQWSGIIFIMFGLVMVGASDMLSGKDTGHHSTTQVITGDMLILVAQIITAVQMVYEEKFVAGMDIPALQAVGYEGLFGFITLGILLVPFYYIHVPFSGNPNGSIEDAIDAFYQIKNSWQIATATGGTVLSIAFFNYAGISVTKEISATSRMVLDSVRTIIIWIVSLSIKWQEFAVLQLGGFIVLIFGMCLYNDIIICQTYRALRDMCIRRDYGNVTNSTDNIDSRASNEA